MESMTIEMQDERERLHNDARLATDELDSKRLASIQQDAATLNQTLSHQNQNGECSITRQTQIDLAGVMLEQWMTEVFINQFHSLDDKAKAELAKALNAAFKTTVNMTNNTNSPLYVPSPARIRSPFELPPKQRNAIQKTLYRTFNADIALIYETSPNLVRCIELHANDHRLI